MRNSLLLPLVAILALGLLAIAPAWAQCPPGYVWHQGRCLPAPPPPILAPAIPPVPPPPMAGELKTVTAKTLNIRDCPAPACAVVAVVYRGQKLRVEGFEQGFYLVRIPGSNLTGWASARFLVP